MPFAGDGGDSHGSGTALAGCGLEGREEVVGEEPVGEVVDLHLAFEAVEGELVWRGHAVWVTELALITEVAWCSTGCWEDVHTCQRSELNHSA